MAADTIPARLQAQAKNRPDHPAYYIKTGGRWVPTTYKTYHQEVRTAAKALMSLGFEPGHTLCILGFNRPEWVIFDLAGLTAGGVPAGIYTTCSAEEVQYIIGHSEARIVLLEDAGQWAKVEAELANLPKLEHVVMMKGATVEHDLVISWEDFIAKAADVEDADLDARVEGLKLEDLATLIYTSGTTGPPKGVMLSHDNLAWTAALTRKLMPLSPEDCSLSYLPLCHIAEQMFSLHAPVTHGLSVYFAESIDAVPDNLKEVQPTIVFGVPRIWEKFHTGISSKLEDAKPIKKKLLAWAQGVGLRRARALNGGAVGVGGLSYLIANKLIFCKLKPAIGMGRARFCISGAAPISKEVLEFMAGLDVTIHEVYGQSEDTGPTSFNRPGATQFGSVGPPLPDVEVKIAADDEILVKGRNVFMGYFKDDEATAATLKDGWLHSGDLGKFDEQGFLHIIGRKKDIIITAGGKNITPKNIEAGLKNSVLISEAVVIGDRRKFLSALLTLDPETAAKWAADNGVKPNGGLHDSDRIRAQIQSDVDAVNAKFARVEHIRKFTILPRELTIEDGELTPTLKVKRKPVADNWSEAIEAMYAG